MDFNLDGWPDLAFVNGNVRRNQGAENGGRFWSGYAEHNQIYTNLGNGKFRDISSSNPALCEKPAVGRGLAVGDFDNDGALDLLITEIDGPARLLRNIASKNGHWLTVRATIPKLKRDAYGAEITVHAGDKSYWRLLQPGYSYCSSNDPCCHFGLGELTHYEAIEVLWPDGVKETFSGGSVDRRVEIRQGAGKTTAAS